MNDNRSEENVKARDVLRDSGKSRFRKYRDFCYGKSSLAYVMKCEFAVALASAVPGAWGLFLRSRLYPGLFRRCGSKVVFGRNITVRHPHKISIGNNVVLDDNCVIDAKGETNAGIEIGDGVFIGRNTIVYCKNGDISLNSGVSISSNCTVFSSNKLTVEAGTIIGSYSYLLSGGEYDYSNAASRFCEQSGMKTEGELRIGENCWLGARVTVLDGACIGNHCVIGAGAVVTKSVPPDSLAVGVPARAVKKLPETLKPAP